MSNDNEAQAQAGYPVTDCSLGIHAQAGYPVGIHANAEYQNVVQSLGIALFESKKEWTKSEQRIACQQVDAAYKSGALTGIKPYLPFCAVCRQPAWTKDDARKCIECGRYICVSCIELVDGDVHHDGKNGCLCWETCADAHYEKVINTQLYCSPQCRQTCEAAATVKTMDSDSGDEFLPIPTPRSHVQM